jgi:hypothetical protein
MHSKFKGCPHVTDAEYLARLKAKCRPVESGCWEWIGSLRLPSGYAWTSYRGKPVPAHRLMHTLVKGPVPEEKDCCHSCDNRKCINPDHLWVGSRQENLLDASSKGRVHCQQKTHCPQGHAYAEHGVREGKVQWRKCRICNRARQRIKSGWSEADAFTVPPIPHTAPRPRRRVAA